ncbi:MAG TPA: sigma-54 dependent transcriptional regulator [Candidatus Limnocylindria bacterium]|jgi:DNA-binding NtrC family response regulator|nr:sigma-54 dependent transcriptional regulator [Candidatus Limnocylindria bacterium]
MNIKGKILLIEDDPGLSGALESVLKAEGFAITLARRGDDGCQLGLQEEFDTVLTDFRLPGMGGLEIVKRLHEHNPRLPIILMTAHGTTETAIEATKLGAFDYLLKPFEMEELIEQVDKSVKASQAASQVLELGGSPSAKEALIGNSRLMQTIYKEVGRIAARPVTVLIRGETGTGKELIARAIYQHSNRAAGPFVAVNCAAIPETLLESELFGHERGAFTGAVERRIGRFEQANGGTLFLDEIGEMGASTQAKLLRVLQERVIQRLGGKDVIPVDVRVIAATHVKLEEAIANKAFREDLLYRLNQVTVSLPPLRERTEDIPELATHFVKKHGASLGFENVQLHPAAIDLLRRYTWPGNVRELENAMRQAILASRGYPIDAEVLEQVLAKNQRRDATESDSCRSMVSETLLAAQRGELEDAHDRLVRRLELELFTQAIALAGGNQAKASRWLGISRVTMREKLRHYGLKAGAEEAPSGGHD